MQEADVYYKKFCDIYQQSQGEEEQDYAAVVRMNKEVFAGKSQSEDVKNFWQEMGLAKYHERFLEENSKGSGFGNYLADEQPEYYGDDLENDINPLKTISASFMLVKSLKDCPDKQSLILTPDDASKKFFQEQSDKIVTEIKVTDIKSDFALPIALDCRAITRKGVSDPLSNSLFIPPRDSKTCEKLLFEIPRNQVIPDKLTSYESAEQLLNDQTFKKFTEVSKHRTGSSTSEAYAIRVDSPFGRCIMDSNPESELIMRDEAFGNECVQCIIVPGKQATKFAEGIVKQKNNIQTPTCLMLGNLLLTIRPSHTSLDDPLFESKIKPSFSKQEFGNSIFKFGLKDDDKKGRIDPLQSKVVRPRKTEEKPATSFSSWTNFDQVHSQTGKKFFEEEISAPRTTWFNVRITYI